MNDWVTFRDHINGNILPPGEPPDMGWDDWESDGFHIVDASATMKALEDRLEWFMQGPHRETCRAGEFVGGPAHDHVEGAFCCASFETHPCTCSAVSSE